MPRALGATHNSVVRVSPLGPPRPFPAHDGYTSKGDMFCGLPHIGRQTARTTELCVAPNSLCVGPDFVATSLEGATPPRPRRLPPCPHGGMQRRVPCFYRTAEAWRPAGRGPPAAHRGHEVGPAAVPEHGPPARATEGGSSHGRFTRDALLLLRSPCGLPAQQQRWIGQHMDYPSMKVRKVLDTTNGEHQAHGVERASRAEHQVA